jgi:hypothetical protein
MLKVAKSESNLTVNKTDKLSCGAQILWEHYNNNKKNVAGWPRATCMG